MNIFKRIARFFTVAYANRQYNKAVRLANELHEKNKDRYFVTISPMSKSGLRIMTRNEYRKFRNKGRFTAKYAQMKRATVYHTPDRVGEHYMTLQEIEKKRLAFLKYVLINAKLAD